MIEKIPYGKQYLDKFDLKMVSKSLKEPLITTGKFVKKFEDKISSFLKVKNTVSCNSGTAALHLAFLASDIKKNDIIIMPAINFVSAFNMCNQLGAKVYLADVDSQTGQMTPESLLNCIKINKIEKIKVILTMYMGGFPENILNFYKIKKKFKCLLIEDACHAFGSAYEFNNKIIKVGSCRHSDISTFSLHPLKPITTGEGGIITTNNTIIANKIRNLRSHGIIRNHKYHWKYDISNPGFNYRLSDINSALGLSQLKKITIFIKHRKKVYNYYKKELNKYQNVLNFPKYNKKNNPTYHLVLININFKKLKSNKDSLLKYLQSKNIMCQFHYIPIYKFAFYRQKGTILKSSENYYKSTLSIPIYHEFNLKKQNIVIKSIKKFINFKKIKN
ncbi:aminotransferase class I/II-fold pyridoxal phosphate-dependent enzyme [Candidatus Pelagibacter sp.]|nr:aminotransferase class I/II-fold pyridoxal phosphate-dependent enzyme [Candidatus Pelagibacter sp.]